jgi:hypothetical protein
VKPGELTDYKPAEGLQAVAVAEAAEKHFARAKDPEKLYLAVEAKLTEQRRYALWRETVRPQHRVPGRAKDDPSERKGHLPDTDPGEQVARRWRVKLGADEAFTAALAEAKTACLRICEQHNQETVRGTEGTGEFERYTPARYIEMARRVMGGIDLDPASCKVAQKTVKADKFFTVRDDGLVKEWFGNVWLNPPYHRELMPAFISKLAAELLAKRIKQAIVLTNNSTDTEWFVAVAKMSQAFCFTLGRIRFLKEDGVTEVNPTQGQTFFYIGNKVRRFCDEFDKIGTVCLPGMRS